MRKVFLGLGLSAMSLLAACKTETPAPVQMNGSLDVMQRVTKAASQCWMKSQDPAFKAYRLDAELNSFSGQPRILLVRRGSTDIRPLLVVMAEGTPAKMQAFGPLMNESISTRITSDVKRWANGSMNCHA